MTTAGSHWQIRAGRPLVVCTGSLEPGEAQSLQPTARHRSSKAPAHNGKSGNQHAPLRCHAALPNLGARRGRSARAA